VKEPQRLGASLIIFRIFIGKVIDIIFHIPVRWLVGVKNIIIHMTDLMVEHMFKTHAFIACTSLIEESTVIEPIWAITLSSILSRTDRITPVCS